LLLAPLAHATLLVALDVEGLAGSSDAVVRATVTRVSSRWTRDGGRIVTDIELDVAETWKGGVRKTIVVMQPGGVVGDLGQRVDGVATFALGEDVVLFLEARGDRFTVAGLAQGRFKVEASSDGATVSARQDQAAALHLVDPATRVEVAAAPLALPLAMMKLKVQQASARPQLLPRVAP
jgi:hypothetical protein